MQKRRNIEGWVLASPIVLGVAVFFILPFFITIKFSFTQGISGAFYWFENYKKVCTSDTFQLAAFNTLRFIITGVTLITIVSLCMALVIKKMSAGVKFLQSTILFPLVIPVGTTVMFLTIFLSNSGMLNALLNLVGIASQDWLKEPYVFWVLVFIFIWKNCGYNVLLMIAGLNMIPKELYETAGLDGANRIKSFVYITLPLMFPTIILTMVFAVTNSFKTYREAFLLGGKRPDSSIYMLQHFLNNNFDNLNYQRLSVAAVVTFLTIFLLTGVFCLVIKEYGRKRK